ncbi:hypothetical protein BJ875DRAFT_481806 [Amylocarpus encephaloides]|uniref:Uncharacterized protein n=1 Tax=Amylocarpus encephaloides TaxID=45428 RepID=A0A9P8C827_9HELO|nr:hypothetical protein BJ875DRAFT_481806 [Amylocarpus encephaloides]
MAVILIDTLWSLERYLRFSSRLRESASTMLPIFSELYAFLIDLSNAIIWSSYLICLPLFLARLFFRRGTDFLLRGFKIFFFELYANYWLSEWATAQDYIKANRLYLAKQLEQQEHGNVRQSEVAGEPSIKSPSLYLINRDGGLEANEDASGASGHLAPEKKVSTSRGSKKARHRLRKRK